MTGNSLSFDRNLPNLKTSFTKQFTPYHINRYRSIFGSVDKLTSVKTFCDRGCVNKISSANATSYEFVELLYFKCLFHLEDRRVS